MSEIKIPDVLKNQWVHTGNVFQLFISGFVIGIGNAIWSLVRYFSNDRDVSVLNGVDVVFGKSTQQYMLITTFILIILVPIWPFLIKTIKVIFETIVFGLSFLFSNALIFLIVAFFAGELEGTLQGHIIPLLKTFSILFASAVIFGPIAFAGFMDDVRKKGSIINWGKEYIWMYLGLAVLMLLLIWYTAWNF